MLFNSLCRIGVKMKNLKLLTTFVAFTYLVNIYAETDLALLKNMNCDPPPSVPILGKCMTMDSNDNINDYVNSQSSFSARFEIQTNREQLRLEFIDIKNQYDEYINSGRKAPGQLQLLYIVKFSGIQIYDRALEELDKEFPLLGGAAITPSSNGVGLLPPRNVGCEGGVMSSDNRSIQCPDGSVYRLSVGESQIPRYLVPDDKRDSSNGGTAPDNRRSSREQ